MNFTSPKTKAFALATIIATIAGALTLLFDGRPDTNPDWTATIAALTSGFGLLTARQNNVTSEKVAEKVEMVQPK